jgi:hypothetical protein
MQEEEKRDSILFYLLYSVQFLYQNSRMTNPVNSNTRRRNKRDIRYDTILHSKQGTQDASPTVGRASRVMKL